MSLRHLPLGSRSLQWPSRHTTVRPNGIPTPDPLTAIREPNDIDKAEEAAWSYIEMMGYVPTPQLLFALKEVAREMMAEKDLIAYCQRKMKDPSE